MWTIEVSEDASEEEINQAILDEIDFDHIRECVAKLKGVIAKCGPLAEVEERTEESDPTAFTRTFHEKRGWICDELASIDPLKVWTVLWDPINGYSYLTSGYEFEETEQRIVEIKTWYIAEKNFDPVDEKRFRIDTEFIISQTFTDSQDDDEPYYVLDIWHIIDSKDLSDMAITRELTSDLYYF
jgi:hypothetical protein